MRVFVTGGTGFLGQAVVRNILNAGHDPVVLVHENPPTLPGVDVVQGDVRDPKSLTRGARGADAVVHLATPTDQPARHLDPVVVEGTRNVVQAAREAEARRFLHVSVLGAGAGRDDDPAPPEALQGETTAGQTAKWRAEEVVRDAGLVYTILRPSLVVGSGGLLDALRRVIVGSPLTVILGRGDFPVAPVARSDVSQAIAHGLGDGTRAVNATYNVCGPETLSFRELVQALRHHFNVERPTVSLPPGLALTAAHVASWFPQRGRHVEALKRLMQGATCTNLRWAKDLNVEPTPFQDALEEAYGPPRLETGGFKSGGSPGMFRRPPGR